MEVVTIPLYCVKWCAYGQRSVHQMLDKSNNDANKTTVSTSTKGYYFGNRPVRLPQDLQGIVRQGQGHRSHSNASYVDRFVGWIDGLGYASNSIVGEPQLDLFKDEGMVRACAIGCARDDNEDERIGESVC